VKIRVSARAEARILEVDEWWRARRQDSPALFWEELSAAFESVSEMPGLRAPYSTRRGLRYWRVLLPRTEQFVYYWVDDAADEVVIETIWGARRRGPRL
jgi:plasmid stabilization system protein ParE